MMLQIHSYSKIPSITWQIVHFFQQNNCLTFSSLMFSSLQSFTDIFNCSIDCNITFLNLSTDFHYFTNFSKRIKAHFKIMAIIQSITKSTIDPQYTPVRNLSILTTKHSAFFYLSGTIYCLYTGYIN